MGTKKGKTIFAMKADMRAICEFLAVAEKHVATIEQLAEFARRLTRTEEKEDGR